MAGCLGRVPEHLDLVGDPGQGRRRGQFDSLDSLELLRRLFRFDAFESFPSDAGALVTAGALVEVRVEAGGGS